VQAPVDSGAASERKTSKKQKLAATETKVEQTAAATIESDLLNLWDPCTRDADSLVALGVSVFRLAGIEEKLVPEKVLLAFLKAVQANHRQNAYHNWQHAFHVLVNTFRFIKPVLSMFRPQKILALLVGAVCHDLGMHRSFCCACYCCSFVRLHCLLSCRSLRHRQSDADQQEAPAGAEVGQ
jgi:hypothetical protein